MGAHILSLFKPKAREFIKGRKGLLNRIQEDLKPNQSPIVWFHCASLGEFEQGKPVIEAYKNQHRDHKILVTFFSPSGYTQKKNYKGADYIYYLPMDTSSNAKRFLAYVNPSIVFFVKYEFWYNYLNQIHKREIPLYNISGLFTPKHNFFKASGSFQLGMLKFFSHFFVQDQRSKNLLESVHLKNVTVSGDTRFDRVLQTIKSPTSFPLIEKFKGSKKLIIIGSSWPEDMEVLYDFINSSDDQVKFLIIPHLIDDRHIKILEKGLNVNYTRYSAAESTEISQSKVLIINTIGMLSSLYQYGEMAYIGGAFGEGVHNILEAVAFGLPVVFGDKNLDKFPETLELIAHGGGFSVSNNQDVASIFNGFLNDQEKLNNASAICKSYVQKKAGATDIIMQHIRQN